VESQKKKRPFSGIANLPCASNLQVVTSGSFRYSGVTCRSIKSKNWILDYIEPQADHPNLFPEAKDRTAVLKTMEAFQA